MARKKKTIDGGRSFINQILRRSPSPESIKPIPDSIKPIPDSIKPIYNSNIHLSTIQKLGESYTNIKPIDLSVNKLNIQVKSLQKFSKYIINKKELMPLLEQVKLILIEKIIEKINGNKNLTFAELLDLLIIFKQLSNQINIPNNSVKDTSEIIGRLQKQLIKEIDTKNINELKQLQLKVDKITKSLNKDSNIQLFNNLDLFLNILSDKIVELQQTGPNQTGPNQIGLRQNELQQIGRNQNNSQQFQVNNRPNKLKNSLTTAARELFDIENKKQKIQKIADETFKLLSHKFDLAIKFLDTIGNRRIKKGRNNSLVNNAVYENKDLAKNIKKLYDLWVELINKYSSYIDNTAKLIIEDKKQEYSQKMFEKQKYVNYNQ